VQIQTYTKHNNVVTKCKLLQQLSNPMKSMRSHLRFASL